MSKLLHEITRESDVGIWSGQTSTARIYDDKIIVGQPYVKWRDNSGSLDFRKLAIRSQAAVDSILAKITADDEDQDAAWDQIKYVLDYHYQ